MATAHPRLSSPSAGAPSAALSRGGRDRLLLGLTALVPLLLALVIARAVPDPNILLTLGLIVAALGVLALFLSTRYAVTLALVALYLGLLEGPVKLGSGGGAAASASRDILIIAISLGAIVRIVVRRERIRLPPLSGWVLAFAVLVGLEAFNPHTHGILKVLGGFRQQLEWLPFFFFAYLLMRSKDRFRKYFLILGVIALANGVVGVYQSRLSPNQLAGWGPGYRELAKGGGAKGQGGRTYRSEGVARIRPPALGSNSGFGGSIGVLALPAIVALLATVDKRRRWIALILGLGALAGIATSASRTDVIGAIVALLGFGILASFRAGPPSRRPLAALLVVTVLGVALGSTLVAVEGAGIFSRYSSISSPQRAASTSVNTKERTLSQIPADIANAPFGIGLASVAAATGFGGISKVTIEEHAASAESQYNSVLLELGLAGLLLWIALTIKLAMLVVRGLWRVRDFELRIDLAAVFAGLLALVVMGFSGPTTFTSPAGPAFWFGVGIAAYWLAGPGRSAERAIAANPAIGAGVS